MVLWRKEYSWRDKPTNRVFVYLGMKKLILLLFLLPTIAFGQTTAIPDANFEQALIDMGYDTGTYIRNHYLYN
jgi:hypothetical protein